jgi:hypothetical protein
MQLANDLRGGRFWRIGWLIAIAMLVAVGTLADHASAAKKPPPQQKGAEDATPPRDTAGAQRAYAAGTRAFESGDMAEAERQLSVAISIGGLPNAQMARALYYRGSASRQLGRPAQAISDLTTAVWLKGGLEGDDRKKAVEARQLAYQEAGLGDKAPPIGGAPLDQSTASTPGAPPAPPAAKPGTIVAVVPPKGASFWSKIPSPSLPTLPSLPSIASLTGSSPTPAADGAAAQPAGAAQPSGTVEAADPAQSFAATPAVVTPAEAAAPAQAVAPQAVASAPAHDAYVPPPAAAHTSAGSWDTQTAASGSSPAAQTATLIAGYAPIAEGPSSPPPQASAAEPPPASSQGSFWNPLAGTGQAISNTGQAVGGFFSNMWSSVSGSSGQGTVEPVAAVTTGSTGAGGWGSETTVHTPQTSSMIQRGPEDGAPQTPDKLPWGTAPSVVSDGGQAARPAQQLASTGAAGGKYKLQVAAVRSRDEAERLTQSLQSYPGVRDGLVTTQIDETVIGSMGTFYRVRLGPYATAAEPNQLCKTLRPQGFDCLVVTQ